MSETSIEFQAGLPLFPGEEVHLQVKWSDQELADDPELGKTVWIPVDDIDSLPDENVQIALWRQFRARQAGERCVHAVYAEPDGTYSHTMIVDKGPLFPSE